MNRSRYPHVDDMTSRERVLAALNFQPTDRAPRDLGGMRSTGISAFAYPKLVAALGLPARPPKIEDTSQMRAQPDGAIAQGNQRMPATSFVFDDEHGGQPVCLDAELTMPDLNRVKASLDRRKLRGEQVREIAALCRRVRESTDRAVFLNPGRCTRRSAFTAGAGWRCSRSCAPPSRSGWPSCTRR